MKTMLLARSLLLVALSAGCAGPGGVGRPLAEPEPGPDPAAGTGSRPGPRQRGGRTGLERPYTYLEDCQTPGQGGGTAVEGDMPGAPSGLPTHEASKHLLS